MATSSEVTFGTIVATDRGETVLLDDLGQELLRGSAPAEEVAYQTVPRDADWVRQSFVTYQAPLDGSSQGVLLDDQDRFNRSFSTSMLKYTDSSPGGNKYINSPAQFTRYADIRFPRFGGGTQNVTKSVPNSTQSIGMGRYFSEAIDDNSQVIHMRLGTASFNSLTQFLTGFYSGDLAAAARGARFSDNFITKWFTRVGNVLGLAIAPLALIPMALLLVGQVARFVTNNPGSRFYDFKPGMPMYWMAVSNMVNQMAVNSGLSSFVQTEQAKQLQRGGSEASDLPTNQTMNLVGRFLPPGLITKDGTIDVYAIANRSNRMEIAFQKRMTTAFKEADQNENWADVVRRKISTDPTSNLRNDGSVSLEARASGAVDAVGGFFESLPETAAGVATSLFDYMQRFNSEANAYNKYKETAPGVEKDPRSVGVIPSKGADGKDSFAYDSKKAEEAAGFFDYFVSNLNDGSEFVSFRVDYTGPVQESFSSSTAESSLASKMNSMSRSARALRFNVADGNIAGGLGAVSEAIKSTIAGVAEVVQIEGLAAVAGNAFVDIPQYWDESIASLPKTNYNVTLISPYGNPVSLLFNIWMPLSMLLATALPLATGKQSHTSPFLVQLFDRGRKTTRLGIVESMSISRGTSNLGFNRDQHALAIEVSFSIKDLSSVVAMPIQPGFDLLNPLQGLFDGDNAFTDYLLTLAGTKLGDFIYRVPMLKYQINRKVADMNTFFSWSHFAGYLASVPGVELLGAAMRGTDRQ